MLKLNSLNFFCCKVKTALFMKFTSSVYVRYAYAHRIRKSQSLSQIDITLTSADYFTLSCHIVRSYQ